jgi:Domain of unknown function (DUF4142)
MDLTTTLPRNRRFIAAALTTLILTSFPNLLLAQAPEKPAAAAPAPADAAKAAAEMAQPLTPADKKFVKEASELLYFELAIVEVAQRRNRPVGVGRDATFTLAAGLHPDLQKAWDELTKLARAKNEKVREELNGVEKRDMEEIRAVNIEKFHKEVVTALNKTAKQLAQTFASTAVQHPVLKKIAATHAPTFKRHATEIAQAAK